MQAPVQPAPLRYDPSFEHAEPDEQQTSQELLTALHRILETTHADYGHAVRSVHAKSHGLLRAELRVSDDLPAELAQGLFAKPGTYPVLMRFSTNPGDVLDDKVSTPRGLAIKVIGVPGERLPGSENHATQDFVLVDSPAFLKPDAKSFLRSLKLLSATTDRAPTAKRMLSAALRGAEKLVESAGSESPTLISLGGHPLTHPLGETYYSQAALLYGDYMAKIAVAPVSAKMTELTGAKVELNGQPNGLRDAIVEFFNANGGEWELRAQLCTSLDRMPIEDASQRWDEHQSPYRPVARIIAAPQTAWTEARARAIDDGMMFSPWHGLAAHRPLGSIMRVRKAAYEMSAQFRRQSNGQRIVEPRTVADLPSALDDPTVGSAPMI